MNKIKLPSAQLSEQEQIDIIVAQIEAARAARVPGEFTKRITSVGAGFFTRIGAGVMAGLEDARLAYHVEFERQTRRTAERLLRRARAEDKDAVDKTQVDLRAEKSEPHL